MKNLVFSAIVMVLGVQQLAANTFEKDVLQTSAGELAITFIGHGSLMMEFEGDVIYIDPVSQYGDYTRMPKADLILITHDHGDHLDATALDAVMQENTRVVLTEKCNEKYPGTDVMHNGDAKVFGEIAVEAVPAYNLKHERSPGVPFHPRGVGNGYVLRFGDTKIYVAGDTENIPEMAKLKDIDVAFLPMNLPYTMTPEMCADAARMVMPTILYPYHFGETDTNELLNLLKNDDAIEVRIRQLK